MRFPATVRIYEIIHSPRKGEPNSSIRLIKLCALAVGASLNFSIIDRGITHDCHLQAAEPVIEQRTKPGPKSNKNEIPTLARA